jgi:glycosyltransferase involved in cell wall biosynthesis
VRATVAICTRNRGRALARTLDSLATMQLPLPSSWEVLVVDNGSTDDTASVIQRFADVLPLRAEIEPRVGLSHARNAAARVAGGEYLLWLDDDVLVSAEWIRAYLDAFEQWPDASFFGGPITPQFDGTPPRWLLDALPNIGNAYAALDLGDAPIPLTRDTLPFGANFAVRALEQRRHAFDPELGRRGNALSAGEEWQVLQELLEEGATGRWVPGAGVRHVIPVERQTVRYLRQYYRSNGASLARVRSTKGEPMLFGRPRWAWREAVSQELAYRVRRLYAPADAWSVHLRRASVAWGLLDARAGKHAHSSS